jgi:hypothetical protein
MKKTLTEVPMRSLRSVWLVALLAMGCSGAESFTGPATIDGSWGTDGSSIPGNFFEMNLASAGATVSGSGRYSGEAGPAGTFTVTGTIDGTTVHLDLTFTQQVPRAEPAAIEHFDGKFTSANVMEGSTTSDTPGKTPGRASYRRF